METAPISAEHGKPGVSTLLRLLAPIFLLLAVIATFVFTKGAGLNVTPAAPVETVQFDRPLLRPGHIELSVRNTSTGTISIGQITINEAIWPFTISPSRVIPRLGSARVTMAYPWVQGEAYEITLHSGNSISFTTSIPVATTTASVTRGTLWSFTLIGFYVGVVPVVLGMFWLPLLARLGPGGTTFLMSATVGLLLYLGIDAGSEALELGAELGSPFQGTGIVGIGMIGTILLLETLSRSRVVKRQTEVEQRISLATMIAVGIGLHNFGEGLAIGAAYAVGAAALGTFLVVGFIIQNITEGLGIIVPLSKSRTSVRVLAVLALVAGGPAIVGAWVGGLVYSQPLSVLFLAIGAGAVFQVAYQIGRELIWTKTGSRQSPWPAFAGVITGMLTLYITGVVIK